MDPKHRKRFTIPSPLKGFDAKSLLADLLAKLPEPDESSPYEAELFTLLKDAWGYRTLFKNPGSLSSFSEKPSEASPGSKGAGDSIDSKEILALLEAGKLVKAKRAARQVLRGINVKEAVADEAHSPQGSGPVTNALQMLALIADMQGDDEQAQKAYKLLVKVYSSNAGEDADATLQYKYLLAECYADEDAQKALDLLGEVIDSCQRVELTGSVMCAAAKSLAAAIQMSSEDPDAPSEAASYLSDAEAVQMEAYRSEPGLWVSLATTISRRAELSGVRDEPEEAKRHYERAIELYREHLESGGGRSIFAFAGLLIDYGQCLLGVGENSKAIRAGKESVTLISQKFGPLSVEVIPSLLGLGHIYRETMTPQGAKKACRVFKRVVLLHEQHFRSLEEYLQESSGLLDAHQGMISAYIALQAYEKAEVWARRAIRVIHDLDDGSRELHQMYKTMAFICELDGRLVESHHYEALAKEAFESFAGPEDEQDESDAEEEQGDEDEEEEDDDRWWRGGGQGDRDDE